MSAQAYPNVAQKMFLIYNDIIKDIKNKLKIEE